MLESYVKSQVYYLDAIFYEFKLTKVSFVGKYQFKGKCLNATKYSLLDTNNNTIGFNPLGTADYCDDVAIIELLQDLGARSVT